MPRTISIIVCSTDATKLRTVEAMYRRMLAPIVPEFIGVMNPKSIAAGYNRGAASSKGELLIFSHDDVEIISPNLAGILETGLSECDLIGIAGTTKLVYSKWMTAGSPFIFGQILFPSSERGLLELTIYNVPRRIVHNIQAIDGVFMATRRDVWQQNPFDEQTFDGFHLYDIDFSFSAFLAGKKLCIRNDIHLLHDSPGDYSDPNWKTYSDRFLAKRGKQLSKQWMHQQRFAGLYVRNRDDANLLMTPQYWREHYGDDK